MSATGQSPGGVAARIGSDNKESFAAHPPVSARLTAVITRFRAHPQLADRCSHRPAPVRDRLSRPRRRSCVSREESDMRIVTTTMVVLGLWLLGTFLVPSPRVVEEVKETGSGGHVEPDVES